MSEFFCMELMYEILKYSDPHTYVQLCKTCYDMNEIGKSLKSKKIEESLKVIVEPNRTSSLLPNGQLHGDTIFTNDSYKNVKHFQTYSFGVLLSETVIFPKIAQHRMNQYISKFIGLDCLSYIFDRFLDKINDDIVCIKTYNYIKNSFMFKGVCNGKTYFEIQYLISTGKKHGREFFFIDAEKPFFHYTIYHKNKFFYREQVFDNKLVSKEYWWNNFSYQKFKFNLNKIDV
jgi:hypothetical protein